MKKIVIILVSVVILLLNYSCSDNGVTVDETVDIQSSITTSINFGGVTLLTIIGSSSVKDADGVLLSYIQTVPVSRNETVPPQIRFIAKAFIKNPNSIDYIKFSDSALRVEDVAFYPKFTLPSSWSDTNLTFESKETWNIKYKNSSAIIDTFSLSKMMHPFYIDSIRYGASKILTWKMSQDSDQLWLNYQWKPDNGKSEITTIGKDIPDIGQYLLDTHELTNLGISGNGLLSINLLRYKIIRIPTVNGKLIYHIIMTGGSIETRLEE